MLFRGFQLIEKFILRKINLNQVLPLQIDITNSCNLACKHCYHPDHKNTGNISLLDWFNIIDQYQNLTRKFTYKQKIIICGGEPLVSPYLWPILEKINSELPSCKISILTNATLINDSFIERIKPFKNMQFQVSMDGHDAKSHDFYRGAGSFEKTVKAIQLLVKNSIQVKLLSILSLNKIADVDMFFLLAKSLNVHQMNFTRLIENGAGKGMVLANQDKSLIGFELRDAYRKIISASLKYQVATNFQKPLMNLVIPGLGRSGKFWEAIIVDYKGNILASSRSRLVIGHALTDGIEEVFARHPLMVALRTGKVEKCGQCIHFKVCGGDRNAAFANSGNFLGADPGCWIDIEENEIETNKAINF